MISNIQYKLSEYFDAVKSYVSVAHFLMSPTNIIKGLKSRTHARYYILNQRGLEQDVLRMDGESALGKVRIRPNGGNIREAQKYNRADGISSAVRNYLNQRHADLIAAYEASLDLEHDSLFKGNYYGILGYRKWSNLFAIYASDARKLGDDSIEQRRTIEKLLRALDNGLEDYIALLAELYPKF